MQAVAPVPAARARRASPWQEIRRAAVWYAFLAPAFVLLLAFMYYPVLAGFYYSVLEWDGYSEATFVGAANFLRLGEDPVFRVSVLNTVQMTLIHLAINLTTPLLAAKLISSMRAQRSRYLFRVVFVIPMIVPWMVVTLIWKFMYVAEIGVINQMLRGLGLSGWTHAWLSEPATALYAIGLMNFPWISGLYFLIYYAGLANVPRELQEAARVDGAGALRTFFGIEIPLITGQIKLVIILTVIGWLQNYSNVLVMTGGGPFQSTMMPGLWMYLSAFKYNDWGYACAIGVVLFAVIFVVTYLNNRFLKSSIEAE